MAIDKVVSASITDSAVTDAKLSFNSNQFRNIIINGDMSVAQRGTSFATANSMTIDRFRFDKSNDGDVTVTQDTDVPSGQGFVKSLKVDVTTADTSIGASQYAFVTQRIEAQNLQYLKYGTANAETLTLSFWVKSNKTGTYCVSLVKIDNTRYDYIAEYSISSASTWEKKTITIAPDSNIQAAGGAIDNDNGIGFYLQFALADGSSRQGTNETWNTSTPATSTSNQVNFLDSTSNEWYITGTQLEVGTSASDFEFLPVDVNLDRCERYFFKNTGSGGHIGYGGHIGDNYRHEIYLYPQVMRASPTLTVVWSSAGAGAGTPGIQYTGTQSADIYTNMSNTTSIVNFTSIQGDAEL